MNVKRIVVQCHRYSGLVQVANSLDFIRRRLQQNRYAGSVACEQKHQGYEA